MKRRSRRVGTPNQEAILQRKIDAGMVLPVPIVELEDYYLVTSDGRVWSIRKKRWVRVDKLGQVRMTTGNSRTGKNYTRSVKILWQQAEEAYG